MLEKNGRNILKKGNTLEKRINKELHDKIVKIYKDIKKDVEKAIKGYKKAWKGSEREVFAEVAFCILTPSQRQKMHGRRLPHL